MAAAKCQTPDLELGDVLRAICRSSSLQPQSLQQLLEKAKGDDSLMKTILNECLITHAYWCLPMVLEEWDSKPDFRTISLAYRSEENEEKAIEVMNILMEAATKDVTDCLDEIAIVTEICGGILLSAAASGKTKIVSYLIDVGCNPNVKQSNFKYTPLHNAAGFGHPDVVTVLLQNGARVDEQNANGLTPLMIAVQNCHCRVVRLLLDVGCDLQLKAESSGYSALHSACAAGCVDCVRWLLDAGAEVDALDLLGCPPLVTAVVHEKSEVVSVLLEVGHCQTDIQDENSRMTALHRAADIGNPFMVTVLLTYNAAPNLTDIHGATPLSLAVNSEHTDVVRLLLPIIGQVDPDGKLLVMSVQRGYWVMAELLYSYGAATSLFWTQCELGWSSVTKRDPDKLQILSEKISSPQTLKHLSRLQTRRSLHHVLFNRVQALELPSRISLYLLFTD